jgi:pyruvate dehydrogenase E1 component
LRSHFEVDRRFIVLAALKALADEGKLDQSVVAKAVGSLGIDPAKANPLNS